MADNEQLALTESEAHGMPVAAVHREANTPLDLLAVAVTDPACERAKLRELLAVKKEWEADEARKAFAADLVRFQGACEIIKPLDQGDKNVYAKLDRLWRETRELRADCGLAVMWKVCEIDMEAQTCRLEGALVHRSGHSERIWRSMPVPEAIVSRQGKTVQNATQRAGSAESYCKRYAFLSLLGIVVGKDDDGAGGAGRMISAQLADEIGALLEKLSDERRTAFFEWAEIGDVTELSEDKARNKILPALKAELRRAGKADDL